MKVYSRIAVIATAVSLMLAITENRVAAQDSEELATAAYTILKGKCSRCHGVEYAEGFQVLNEEALKAEIEGAPPYVKPGSPEKSYLFQRVEDNSMPPEGVTDRPSAEEIETLRKWILAGAPFPKSPDGPRDFVSEEEVLRKIRDHLQNLDSSDRPHQRYFSLHHLHNNPSVTDDDMRVYRASFVKLINSLTRRNVILRPEFVDPDPDNEFAGSIFVLDLRKVGWQLNDWRSVLAAYPYGLSWNDQRREISEDIDRLIGEFVTDGIPYVRADWFVVNAARPPHYHRLLELPETIDELEQTLGVDMIGDFRNDQMRRAGFAGSGVSRSNRLVDRHVGRNTRYYYRSYDFGKSFGRSVLFRFPLGPRFTGNEFDRFAFEHDGGEVIWALPNGFQAYYITDGQGNRLDEAPVSVVRDLTEISGGPVVVNGVSCLGCHRVGVNPYSDAVRETLAVTADARQKVLNLYAEEDETSAFIERDRREFAQAMADAVVPYLFKDGKIEGNLVEAIAKVPEPINEIVRKYQREMTLEEAARELGYEDIEEFKGQLGIQALQNLGLAPLALDESRTIPRAMWDTLEESSASVFQRAAQILGIGSAKQPVQSSN
ncbi:MAG: transcriptional regulator [Pirellulales bacterium]|nr:transcriptional regulator [Pirellulales bacterium]